jgi:hypothetical protein
MHRLLVRAPFDRRGGGLDTLRHGTEGLLGRIRRARRRLDGFSPRLDRTHPPLELLHPGQRITSLIVVLIPSLPALVQPSLKYARISCHQRFSVLANLTSRSIPVASALFIHPRSLRMAWARRLGR